MTKFFMIHGAYGNPSENWFPWLKEKLEELGHTVFVPTFPTPENQTLINWTSEFESYINFIDDDSVLIGHSLGPAFILSILEKVKVKACYFVAGFISSLDNPEFDEINETFVERKFEFEKILNNCEKFIVIHSDNDPYVPLSKGHELANQLNCELVLIENAGHFNSDSGYGKFEFLYNKIIDEI